MIFVSDQAFSSKWCWIGVIRNGRRPPKYLNENTWMITESAATAKIPPIRSSRKIVCVKIAKAAKAPPSAIEAGVPHEQLGGPRVVPEEADQPADQCGGDDCEVELRVEALPGRPRADPSDHVHRREGEQRDDHRAGREPVHPVRQVDAVRGARDHQEEQSVPRVPELEGADPRDVDLRREVLVLRGDPDADRDRTQEQELPAAVQPERALVCQLDVVVEEPDRAAGECHEEHGQGGNRVLARREESEAARHQDEEAAEGRRPLLNDVPLGTFLADLLSELVASQERDEAWAEQSRKNERDHARNQDGDHARTAASASATTSSPRAREALTRTQSPGSTTSSTAAAAAAASAYQRVTGPPTEPSRYSRASSPTATSVWMPSRAASTPTSRWKAGAPGPSSAISPRIATRRRGPARSTRYASAARIETGFAL